MRVIPDDLFFAWLLERRIRPDARYPNSNSFDYHLSTRVGSWWEVPTQADQVPRFLADALDAMGAWSECVAWPRAGSWVDFTEGGDPKAALYAIMLDGAGVPEDREGAVRFQQSERNQIIALAAAPLLFGMTVWEDILFFPDHGELFFQCDHHQHISVTFSDASRMSAFISNMRDRGHMLDE